MFTYWNTSIPAIVGLIILFGVSALLQWYRKETITLTKISICGALLAITFALNTISGFIPTTRVIQFQFGIIAVFVSGLAIGPVLTFLMVLSEDALYVFTVGGGGQYHPLFPFGMCLLGFSACLIAKWNARFTKRIYSIVTIVITFFIAYTLMSFVFNPIALVALGWVPRLGWALYVPRLIKWIPEIAFYTIIINALNEAVAKRYYVRLNQNQGWVHN